MVGEDSGSAVPWPVPEQAVAVEAFAEGAADPLSMHPYAEVLADMAVARQTPTPLSVLIDGPWGSGKTTLTHMIQAEVARHPGPWPQQHVFVTFDAWANEDAADLGAAVAASVMREAGRHRRLAVRFLSPLPARLLPLQRRAARAAAIYGPAALVALIMARWQSAAHLVLSVFHSHAGQASTAGNAGAHLASGTIGFLFAAYFRQLLQLPGLRDAERWVKAPAEVAGTGDVDTVARQIRDLLGQALRGRRRLVLVVDNLDRCNRTKALQICDTISHLIEAPGVICFVAADAGELRAAVAERLRLADDDPDNRDEADALLDKMFSLRLRLPEMSSDRLWEMIAHPPGDHPATVRRIRRGVRRRIARAASEALAATARRHDGAANLTPGTLAEMTEALCSNAAWSRNSWRVNPADAEMLAGVDLTWLGQAAPSHHGDLFSVEIRRATRFYFLNSAERLVKLDDGIKPWLRLPPRRAKRLYNHARLLYALSLSRGVLGSSVTPRDIGLWAVLSDTWPGAADVIARNNEDLRALVRNRALTDKDREEGLELILESFKLSQRELRESKAFLVKLVRAGDFDAFVLAVPELADLLPFQRDVEDSSHSGPGPV